METNAVVAVAVVHLTALCSACEDEREEVLQRQRLNRKHHSQLLLHEGQFRRYYRMSFCGFEELVRFLAPYLRVDEARSRRRTGIDRFTPVNKVQMCISWFARYSYKPVRVLSGSGKTAFYNSIYEGIKAIQSCEQLQLRAPVTPFEQRRSAFVFSRLSSQADF
ncbi:hypothetical protein PC116_g20917 [Phytophthora cactorum]|uniref:Uncharacterized protein n=1 Tax=Phytophthora cactorum TaxID=29920 RepID=A0A8T1C5X4_9STRA|nr:hypothetical protein PC114_g18390 [Phytophthora cactorum]KAG2915743.1 hypothetical protein PC117_g17929 [Phytophthora cactorum]KAG2996967.1 hypothetical protein PC119_g17768 [Phytophthora cactorum]KAG3141734.1 hypothetical protein C6341_g19660 [Phytophthora cactorum]KAG4230802.1 hypothetical protein PC116_g20917 [Phytophthora cactorum]